MLLFRFGVVLTPESEDVEMLILGSRPEMGHWDPARAVPMTPSRKVLSTCEPCLWTGEVLLAEPYTDKHWFKFVKRVGGNLIWEGTTAHCHHTNQSYFCLSCVLPLVLTLYFIVMKCILPKI